MRFYLSNTKSTTKVLLYLFLLYFTYNVFACVLIFYLRNHSDSVIHSSVEYSNRVYPFSTSKSEEQKCLAITGQRLWLFLTLSNDLGGQIAVISENVSSAIRDGCLVTSFDLVYWSVMGENGNTEKMVKGKTFSFVQNVRQPLPEELWYRVQFRMEAGTHW